MTPSARALESLDALAAAHPPLWRDGASAAFALPGYTVEIHLRDPDRLVVSFDSRRKDYPPSATRPAWGLDFLARRRLSALHVKPDASCWYRGPALEAFFRQARACGLFDAFDRVMTYGGSMGGFGALSFARLTRASSALAYNPQVRLDASVRDWETRWPEATGIDWDHPLCDIDRQIAETAHPVVVIDPYFVLDRRQVDLVSSSHLTRLHVPFVRHRIPAHLQNMNMLKPLFDQVVEGPPDVAWFRRAARARRGLKRYARVVLARSEHRPARHARLTRLLPPDGL